MNVTPSAMQWVRREIAQHFPREYGPPFRLPEKFGAAFRMLLLRGQHGVFQVMLEEALTCVRVATCGKKSGIADFHADQNGKALQSRPDWSTVQTSFVRPQIKIDLRELLHENSCQLLNSRIGKLMYKKTLLMLMLTACTMGVSAQVKLTNKKENPNKTVAPNTAKEVLIN